MKYILSIDGGGIRGLIPLYFLMHLEQDILKMKGRTVKDTFDLYAGTSVGAIIVGSLVYTEYPTITDLIKTLYTEQNFKNIFTPYPGPLKYFMLRPKYSNKFKTKLIKDAVSDKKITDTNKKVLIPVYSMTEQRPKFYKSYKIDDPDEKYNASNKKLMLADVINASSSAPIYFPSVEYESDGEEENESEKSEDQKTVKRVGIDGAVFCNNPCDCIFADALRLFPKEDITILSISTGSKTPKKRSVETKKWGPIQWVSGGIVDVILSSNEEVVDYKTRHFAQSLGHKYLRIDGPTDIQLDEVSKVPELIKIAEEWYKKSRPQLMELFDEKYCEPKESTISLT